MYVFLYALRGPYTACAFHQMASSWLPQVNELNYGYVPYIVTLVLRLDFL